jgi:hypothetical protein
MPSPFFGLDKLNRKAYYTFKTGWRLIEMIIEKTKRLKINDVLEFVTKPDDNVNIEGRSYPGDRGRVFDLEMPIEGRKIRILLFDSEMGRDKLLTGRFIYGKDARFLYRATTGTVAKVLGQLFPGVLGDLANTREHQILRAGRALSLAPFIPGIKTQGDDFKRKPVAGKSLYQAQATDKINWGGEECRIFSDICPASGSTMEAFTKKAVEETKLKKLIFNCSTSAINALYRVAPIIPPDVETIFISWEALFSVWRKDVTLPGGSVIHSGTIINLNVDPDFPDFHPIAPESVFEHIHCLYQKDRVDLLPDIPGEVGEKIQDSWVGPLTYDFLEFYRCGIDISQKPWFDLASSAWSMPGVKEEIKNQAPEVFEKMDEILGERNFKN